MYKETIKDLNVIEANDNEGQSLAAILAKGCRSTRCKKMLNRLLQKRPNKIHMYAVQGQLKKMLHDAGYTQRVEAIIKNLTEIEKRVFFRKKYLQ